MIKFDERDLVAAYFEDIGNPPLLSREQEVELAKRMERGREAEAKLARDGHNPERAEELKLIIEEARAARERIVRANARLVASIAHRHKGRGTPLPDLIQEGNLALMRAASKFDWRRGCKFSTYATCWIRQYMKRAIVEQGRAIRIPPYMSGTIYRLLGTAHRLEQELGREPTTDEIAEEVGMEPRRAQRMLEVFRRPLSLEEPVGEGKDNLGDFIKDESVPVPIEEVERAMLRKMEEDLLTTLAPRQARVLRLRFGLHDGHCYPLEEIGQMLGLTRERIRQIEQEALRWLRHPTRSGKLHGFLLK